MLNVGIGTTSPGYALQVSGDVSISGNYKVNGVNIGSGTVGSVTAAATTGNPITVSSSTTSPSIDITRATASVNGYLASSDFTTFNNKLSQALNSGSIFVGDVSNIATAQVLSGDATIDNAGILTLVNNSVTGAKILDSTITSADLTSSVANALWSVNGSGDVSRTTGNVGIGNTTPAKLLHVGSASVGTGLAVANFQNVDGTCTITPASSGSGIACSSDERLKENFQDVTGAFALYHILQLQAVTYNFKTSSTDNRRTGYKAQEVQKVAPEFVRENEDGLLQVYYDAFIPWITEAIKTLYSRITGVENHQASQDRQIASKADKTEVDQLKAENAKLKADAEKQKQENAAMKARLDKIEKMLKSK